MADVVSRLSAKHGRAVWTSRQRNLCAKVNHREWQTGPGCSNITIPLPYDNGLKHIHLYSRCWSQLKSTTSSGRYGKWRDDIGLKSTIPSSAFFSDPSTPLNVFDPEVQCTAICIPFLNILSIRIGRCERYIICPMPINLYHFIHHNPLE